jgi:hypothetical protein
VIGTDAKEKNMRESEREGLNSRRPVVVLNSGLEKSLSAYASAAVAAGVSLLAMTRFADAKIVYTPAHTNISVNNRDPVLLDLNHDGIADFSFWNTSKSACCGQLVLDLQIGCAAVPLSSHRSTCRSQNNEIWGRGTVSERFASALHAGFPVRANKGHFQQAPKLVGSYPPIGPVARMAGFGEADFSGFPSSQTSGQWLYTKHRYLGLQFTVAGQVHYGWARVAVTRDLTQRGLQVTLTGYAYETIPNKPIITGKTKGPDVVTFEPANLGHLAQGASGIPVWRKSGGNWKSAAH